MVNTRIINIYDPNLNKLWQNMVCKILQKTSIRIIATILSINFNVFVLK
jgi:uncharacterized membrane protein